MHIYCCACMQVVWARLTDGREIYPGREEFYDLPFWRCDRCHNYVGCHYKSRYESKTTPNGSIPFRVLRQLRTKVHKLMDPMWKEGDFKRNDLYREISKALGYEFHAGDIRTCEEAYRVLGILEELRVTKK